MWLSIEIQLMIMIGVDFRDFTPLAPRQTAMREDLAAGARRLAAKIIPRHRSRFAPTLSEYTAPSAQSPPSTLSPSRFPSCCECSGTVETRIPGTPNNKRYIPCLLS